MPSRRFQKPDSLLALLLRLCAEGRQNYAMSVVLEICSLRHPIIGQLHENFTPFLPWRARSQGTVDMASPGGSDGAPTGKDLPQPSSSRSRLVLRYAQSPDWLPSRSWCRFYIWIWSASHLFHLLRGILWSVWSTFCASLPICACYALSLSTRALQ